MRNGIYLQPRRAVLVRRRNLSPADAGWRKRGLPVPGMFAEGCGADFKQSCAL